MKQDPNPSAPFVNPIDADKITENPGTLPYAHTKGGAIIRPTEKGTVQAKSIAAMEQQTDRQLRQLYDQMKVLAEQAEALQRRAEISRQIYEADMNFDPVIGHTYFLYLRKNGQFVLSMVSPEEWGKKIPFEYISEVSLLADHTWEVLRENLERFTPEN
ncbi:MAG: DUF2452 domain-containing protein [Microscillaceae bacterium]|nr:DUF2452 domain-containing protein [Microscillaceae bacterium]